MLRGCCTSAAFLIALEQSGLGAAIRQSAWAYPAANVGHIVALTLFAASVAIMDLRMLGAFAATPPASVVRPARRVAMLGLRADGADRLHAVHGRSQPRGHERRVPDQGGADRARRAQRSAGGAALVPALDDMPAFAPLPARVRVAAVALAADLGVGGGLRAADRVFWQSTKPACSWSLYKCSGGKARRSSRRCTGRSHAGVTVHAQAPTIKRPVLQKADVPDGKKHEVVFGMAELPAGVAIGKHSHPGIEQGTVVSGEWC